MVKKPKDYSKGKIYMVVCRKTGLVYVGSTTKQYLSQRLDTHRGDYKKWLSDNVKYNYCYSFVILENNDYYIKLLQLYPCTCSDELRMKEQEYIDANECVNKNNAYTDKKEYHKNYNVEHKEEKHNYNSEYYEEHKEELIKNAKVYYEENKEKMKEYKKIYNKVNKEKIAEKAREKINCICGSCICKSDKAKHERTQKHINFINSTQTQ